MTLSSTLGNKDMKLKNFFFFIDTGYIDKLLSWKAFIPLSRLTYGVYLIHPIILYWYFGSVKAIIDMSIFELVSPSLVNVFNISIVENQYNMLVLPAEEFVFKVTAL